MRSANALAMIMGLFVAAVGALGVVAPAVLLEFGRALQSTEALYAVAAVRILFGAILVWVAPASRVPKVLRVIGAFIIIAGAVTPFFGVERSRAMFDWWSTQGSFFTRAWACVAIAFGIFVIYAVIPSRKSAAA